jgi:myo-inositol-1(or 4)-monophosphatase
VNLESFLNIAKRAAAESGKLLKANFSKDFSPEYKSSHDIGLEIDKESERIILDIISRTFPGHNIYSEEAGQLLKDSEYTWYIDPLDGTNNYFAGIAYFAVSISLKFRDELIIGVVYNPVTEQMYEASKGKGAYLNGTSIRPSSMETLDKAVLSFIKGHYTYSVDALRIRSQELEREIENSVRRKLSMWAPALDWCLAASGRIDGIISYESELEDQYAGTLIALEAGMNVVGFNGEPYKTEMKRITASGSELLSPLLNITSKYA